MDDFQIRVIKRHEELTHYVQVTKQITDLDQMKEMYLEIVGICLQLTEDNIRVSIENMRLHDALKPSSS